MPDEGVTLTPSKQLLSAEEIYRLCSIFVGAGVTKLRFTGGEPLVRRDIVDIIARVNTLRAYGLQNISMTTNGVTLSRKLASLKQAGLNNLNISLDTLGMM